MSERIDALRNWWLWICIVIFLFIVYRIRRVSKKTKVVELRDITMTQEGRWLHVRKVVCERLGDTLITAVLDGEITGQEANDLMAICARGLKQPIEPLQRERKDAILKAQLRNEQRRRQLNGNRTERIPLPEPKKDKTIDPDSLAAIMGS